MAYDRIIIAGAGHAGGSAAAMLRQLGWKTGITLVGDEPLPPYQRPPLSKAWLTGEADADSLALRPLGFYNDADIELKLGLSVTKIDPAEHRVTFSDGDTMHYAHLILATGSRARRIPLPGIDLANVLELRTAADADKLKAVLGRGSVLPWSAAGISASKPPRRPAHWVPRPRSSRSRRRVLARVACEILSNFFQDFHRSQGVAIELNAGVQALEGVNGTVTGVRLADGRVIPCDAALIGVGGVPNEELARDAGIACDGGIVVDLNARTSDPDIFAIGDCTKRPLPLYGRTMRLESVPNALEQAKQAASAICGRPQPAPEVPWFWSDQYDLRLQIVGIPFDTTEVVVRGDVAAGKFALFHLTADGTVQAVEAVNASTEFMGGRRIIQRRRKLTAERISDMTVTMQELAS
jgi:3-phenylpropionate/trans-cinnamate dioxygenase ferredoxin reductase subunit